MIAVLLDRYLRDWRHRSFAWGEADCVRFTAGWVALVTGRDPVAATAGRYAGCREALRLMRGVTGSADLVEATGLILGAPLDLPLMARLGDVAALATPAGPALGLCAGDAIAAPGPAGLVRRPLTAIIAAWRIGGPTAEVVGGAEEGRILPIAGQGTTASFHLLGSLTDPSLSRGQNGFHATSQAWPSRSAK